MATGGTWRSPGLQVARNKHCLSCYAGKLGNGFLTPDLTSYLLIGFIIFSLATLLLGREIDVTGRWARVRISAILNIIIAVLCEVAYVRTMMFIDSTLRIPLDLVENESGFVQYLFPFFVNVTNAFRGYQEASFMRAFPDFTAWLLFISLIIAVKLLKWKPDKTKPRGSSGLSTFSMMQTQNNPWWYSVLKIQIIRVSSGPESSSPTIHNWRGHQ